MKSNIGFYGLLLYIMIYYSQLGSRYTVLGNFRIELLVGSVVILLALKNLLRKNDKITEVEKSVLYPIGVFIAACLISIPTTIAGQYTIEALIGLFKSISILFMIYAFVVSEKELKIFVYVLLFMSAFVFSEAFINSLAGKSLHADGGGLVRLYATTGIFSHPNALGGLTAGIIPIIYFIMSFERSLTKKIIYASIGVIGVIVIIKTESRSAMVGMLSACLYIWSVSKKKMLSFTIIMVLLLIGWTYLDNTTKARYLSILDSKAIIAGEELRNEHGEIVGRGSMSKRYQIIIDALILFSQRPITGYGIGGYQVARIEKLGRWQVAHNAYSQCLAELGMVGFIPFVLILVNVNKALNKGKQILTINDKIDKYKFTYKIIYAFQGYLFVHLVLAMFGHTPYQNYWWIPAAVSLVVLRILRNKRMDIAH